MHLKFKFGAASICPVIASKAVDCSYPSWWYDETNDGTLCADKEPPREEEQEERQSHCVSSLLLKIGNDSNICQCPVR